MSSARYKPPGLTRGKAAVTSVDTRSGRARGIAVGTVQAHRERARIAAREGGTPFLYLQFQHAGRRCSCYEVEDTPTVACYVCFGTGIVGGYRKLGCRQHYLDVTTPDVKCVAVLPDYQTLTRPIRFALHPEALTGYVEWTVNLGQDALDMSALEVYATCGPTGSVDLLVRDSRGRFCEATPAAVLDAVRAGPTTLRAVLSRSTFEDDVPTLGAVLVRVRVSADDVVWAHKDLETTAALEWGGQSLWIPFGAVVRCVAGDILVDQASGKRWYVHTTTPFDPMGLTIAWDALARYIEPDEPFHLVPA